MFFPDFMRQKRNKKYGVEFEVTEFRTLTY